MLGRFNKTKILALVVVVLVSLWVVTFEAYGAKTKEIKVSSEEEFFQAINSDVCLVLEPGVYNLTNWASKKTQPIRQSQKLQCAFWDTNGGQLSIGGVHNLQIRARDAGLPTQIVVEPTHANVLRFENCQGIKLQGLILGHANEPGSCTGNVLSFYHCQDIVLNNLNIYGCGAYGVETENVQDLSATGCWIHDCTYGIVTVDRSCAIGFKDSYFTYNKRFDLICGNYSDISFERCHFLYNQGDSLVSRPENMLKVSFEGCTFGDFEKKEIDKYIKGKYADIKVR